MSKGAAAEIIQALEALRETAREFADREKKLLVLCHSQSTKEKRDREAALEAAKLEYSTAANGIDAEFGAAKAALEGRHARARQRVDQAARSALNKSLAAIEETRGRRKFELQKQMLDTERQRDASLAANERIITTFRKADEELKKLEAEAMIAFRKGAAYVAANVSAQDLENEDLELASTVEELGELTGSARGELDQFQPRLFPKLFGRFMPWFVISLLPAGVVFGLSLAGSAPVSIQLGGIASGVLFVLSLILWGVAFSQTKPVASSVGNALGRARGLHSAFWENLDTWKKDQANLLEHEATRLMSDLQQQWTLADETAGIKSNTSRERNSAKSQRVKAKVDALHQERSATATKAHEDALQHCRSQLESQRSAIELKCQQALDQFHAELQSGLNALAAEWCSKTGPCGEAISEASTTDATLFQNWTAEGWKRWTMPRTFAAASRFGSIEVEAARLCEIQPKDSRLALPLPERIAVPALVTYPDQGGLLFETAQAGRAEAIATLNTLVLRLLAGAPPGKAHFTFIDPVGLGQSFSGVMHLADYEERLVNGRIWTQSNQIDEKLAELTEHMEKVIQMYLRNDYQSIVEYNEEAGTIAEAYHFLVVADFPAGFNDSAARRLLSIATSGARCGVFAMIHWDRRQPLPHDVVPDALRKSSIHISTKGNQWSINGAASDGIKLVLEQPPEADFVTAFIHKVGEASRDSNRVEVPFERVAPAPGQIWTEDTTDELRVPIGRSAATKLQYLALGRDTKQHALVAGKTGSGKSTLFHVMITNLALWCSPEQVEFYLIDFKKGVEFKAYATHRLPHARVVAIESDREFGLSVLQRVDDELRRRGDMFRKLGAQNLAGYKKAGGTDPMPRSLLLIDEFQELFVEDDKVSQTASVLLDRIVRQGRAFGIHVILGSQTLGGAYTVARTTLGQMVVRIALQCNEADAYLIMDDGNPAPRLLSRPGEGIYNDAAGAIEGNSPFQAVWLADEARDAALTTVRTRANAATHPGPIVFEGNAPADVRENLVLATLLNTETFQPAATPRFWLGAPNSIKGPTEAAFARQNGNHLLIVGQRDEAVLSMLGVAFVSLGAQFPREGVRLMLLDASAPGSSERDFLERAARTVPQGVEMLKYADIGTTLASLVEELDRRTTGGSGENAPPMFLFIHQMQRFGKLRHEDDFSFSDSGESGPKPDALLTRLITEGASAGIHIVATFDSVNNVNRFLSRKTLSEFEMRVLFQMSANDSALLIDSPRAGTLGLHRAIFYNEQQGYLEVFRPYALPEGGWFDEASAILTRPVRHMAETMRKYDNLKN